MRDAIGAAKLVSIHPDTPPITYCIHDFSQAVQIEPGTIAVAIVSLNSSYSPVASRQLRVAIVASEEVAKASNASSHAHASAIPTRVFRARLDAIDWAGDTGLNHGR